MPTSPVSTFEVETAKLTPLYPNGGWREMNVALQPTLIAVPGAPSAAAAAGAGMGTGAYRYAITFVNAFGETSAGTEATVTTTGGNNQVSLTAIPTGGSTVTARKVYRTLVGGGTGTTRFVATIADNTTTTYADSTADGSLGAAVPTVNTAGLTTTFAKGLVLGELTSAQGVFKAYASGNSDGSQVPKGLLAYAVSIDGGGNVSLAGEWGQTQRGVPMYVGGGAIFKTTDLTGLDANAVTVLGAALVQGTVANGQLRF